MPTRRSLCALLATVALLASLVSVGGPANAGTCISTPQEYQAAWKSRSSTSVAPGLMGTVHTVGAKHPYPRGFWKAWAVGNSGLENFLKLNARDGADQGRVGIGVLSLVGFPDLDVWQESVALSVYSLPRDSGVRVPTFATWFRLFEDRWPARSKFPEDAQRDLIRSYSTLTSDPVEAFESVTGCSRDELLAGQSPSRDIGCNESFMRTIESVGPSPYDGGATRTCLKRFAQRYAGPRDASSLRGFLYQCQDAGFLFSGVGWTYNTYANPLLCGSAQEQETRQRYTEREFVLSNVKFKDMDAVRQISLALAPVSERDFLSRGYC